MSYIPQLGFGAYPDNPCYDPNRPSWLPYFFDDITESNCKFPTSLIGSLPQVESNVTGVLGQTVGATTADIADAAAAGAASAGQGILAGGANNLTTGGSVMLIAAGVVGFMFLMAMVKK